MNVVTTSATPFTRARAKRRAEPTGHATLLTAFAAAQHEARTVMKSARNEERDFSYATAESIIIEAKAILSKHGLAVLPIGTSLRKSDIVEVGGVELVSSFVLVHPDSGQERDLGERVWPVVVHHDQTLSDAHASADTSLLAYFLRGLLQMPRVEEGRDLDAARIDRKAPPPTEGPRPGTTSVGSGARRPGGSVRAQENLVRVMKAVDAELERMGVADELRDQRATKILGRSPITVADCKELLARLKKMKG